MAKRHPRPMRLLNEANRFGLLQMALSQDVLAATLDLIPSAQDVPSILSSISPAHTFSQNPSVSYAGDVAQQVINLPCEDRAPRHQQRKRRGTRGSFGSSIRARYSLTQSQRDWRKERFMSLLQGENG